MSDSLSFLLAIVCLFISWKCILYLRADDEKQAKSRGPFAAKSPWDFDPQANMREIFSFKTVVIFVGLACALIVMYLLGMCGLISK